MFNSRPVHVGFVVNKVALRQVFHRVILFSLSVPFHQCSILIHLPVMLCEVSVDNIINPFCAKIKCPVGSNEDWNLDEGCMRKGHNWLLPVFSILSTTL